MKRHLTRAVALAIGIALLAAVAAIAKPKQSGSVEIVEVGNLVITDAGGISPEKLPRHSQAPITAHLHAKIATKDGAHPPAARMLTIDFDRTLQVNAKGLPACTANQLKARSAVSARRACPNAIVGSGVGEVEVAFPEQDPFTAKAPLTAFNGGVHGRTTLLFVHTYIDVPAPTAVVVEVKITPVHNGHFGLHTVTRVPPIAGGAGSVTGFELKLGRRFEYGGQRESYLTASCPTGHYFVRGHVSFGNGTVVHLTHVLPCTPEA
jgi:hypothetical protein